MPEWLKSLLVILGWATSCAAVTLATIFQGLLLPKNINGGGLYSQVVAGNPFALLAYYAGNITISIIAVIYISDAGKSLISFFASYVGTGIITYLVLGLPEFVGVYDPSGVIIESAGIFTFTAIFPVLMVVNFAGTFLGILLSERLS
jgi:hypothetical protein